VDDKRYRVLRGRHPARPSTDATAVDAFSRVAPALVGRQRHKDTVLAPGAHEGQWKLCLDLAHAVLFDHPGDHVPLMALLEGFRQLGHLTSCDPAGNPRKLVELGVGFRAFAELDAPIQLSLDASGPTAGDAPMALTMEASQDGRSLARCETTWALAPARPTRLPERIPA
ncbi:AfsA-related hotdog domain-containing protein, partial [Streptomyces sp. NPDC058221]|uniref:AfsA-related hotdog domain-containing protein n=1 Tax=Streptomyces sp. NPDC058221 TaxID=3346388 RepID=UPI0036E0B2BA